jgi:hypothetical protein
MVALAIRILLPVYDVEHDVAGCLKSSPRLM